MQHLEVRDAGLLEHRAVRRKPCALVKALGAALGMQQHLPVAARAGGVHQGVQHTVAQVAAAHLLFDGHAADAGHARRVLHALMDAAKDRGDAQVLLHAQCSAEGFYKRSGFAPHGAIFEEAGIAHIEMVRSL